MNEFERVLKQLGSFGAYQRRVFILVSMFETPVAWAMLLPIFLNVVPDWKCLGPSNVSIASNLSLNSSNELPVKQCAANGSICPQAVFTEDIYSIVREV